MSTEATVKKLKRRVGADLLAIPRVTGVGICDDAQGAVLAVYLSKSDAAVKKRVKTLVHGAPVRFVESGTFVKR
ncbi:MAG: hypothetical protein R3F13_15960 [Prosthecobacter sp.]